jgi:hypothetical protein
MAIGRSNGFTARASNREHAEDEARKMTAIRNWLPDMDLNHYKQIKSLFNLLELKQLMTF